MLPLRLLLLMLPAVFLATDGYSLSQTLRCELRDNDSFESGVHLSGTDGRESCSLRHLSPSSSVSQQQQQYRIMAGGAKIAEYFRIKDADLTIKRPIDRESICRDADVCCNSSLSECPVTLKVAITSREHGTEIVLVQVHIIDVNDHSPKFTSRSRELTLLESSEVGTEVSLPIASDPDSDIYSIYRYSLQPDSKAFALVQQKSGSGQLLPKLRQLQPLDREQRSNYTFVLVAHERDQGGKSGSISLTVRIRDENDNSPKFQKKDYTATVNESLPSGHQVLCVSAKDVDSGENARLSYHISPMSGTISSRCSVYRDFRINSVTGCITVQSLSYKRCNLYVFNVMARDHAKFFKEAEVPVKILVNDVNDNKPKISVEFYNLTAPISESYRPVFNKKLALVTVTDKDTGPAGQTECRVEAAGHRQQRRQWQMWLKAISGSENSYNLMLNGTVDREDTPYAVTQICCRDLGSPSLTECFTRQVKVTDINDQAPDFGDLQLSSRVIWLRENMPPRTNVTRIQATDADEAPNNRLNYSIDSLSKHNFAINPGTGDLYTIRLFDREVTRSYTVIITATDTGGLQASVTLTIRIKDVNDEPPIVEQPYNSAGYDFEVEEEMRITTKVGRVKAKDADSSEFGRLRYSLLPSRDAGSFRIQPSSGQITTRRKLDRELQEQYKFVVLIVDNPSGVNRHSTTVPVTVQVLDTNDCHPTIQFPTAQNSSFGISYHEPAGQLMLQVRASDRDARENGLIHFSLLGSPDKNNLFVIDSSDGKIKVRRHMSESDIGRYLLTVVVADSGSSPRSTNVSIVAIVDKSAPRQFLPDGRRIRRSKTTGSLTVLVVALACALLLLLLLLSLYACHRRGLFGDESLSGLCCSLGTAAGVDTGVPGVGVGFRAAAGDKQLQRHPADPHESLAFLTAHRTANRHKHYFPSVTSTLNQSEDTAISFEDQQYITCGHRRMRRDGSQQPVGSLSAENFRSLEASTSAATASPTAGEEGGNYEAARVSSTKPPEYYDLELPTSAVAVVAALGSQMQQLQQLNRRPSQPSGGEAAVVPAAAATGGYDRLHQGKTPGQTLNHRGRMYSIPKASYV